MCWPPRMFQLPLQPAESHLHTTCPHVCFVRQGRFFPSSWLVLVGWVVLSVRIPREGGSFVVPSYRDQSELSYEMCPLFSGLISSFLLDWPFFFFFLNKKVPTALTSVHLATLTFFCFPVSQSTGSGTHSLNGKLALPGGSVETRRGKWRRLGPTWAAAGFSHPTLIS